ncbi:MAG: aldehyde dehydrogenase family protein [Planctomycetota bacterium]
MRTLGHWIDGREVPLGEASTLDVVNPDNDQPIARIADADCGSIDSAVLSAHQAFVNHRDTGPSEREAWLLEAADRLNERQEEFVEELIDENGSPITKARREVSTSINVLRAAAGACRRTTGDTFPTDVVGRFSLGIRKPLGVVAGILPFNVPLIKAVKHTAMAIATGNAVVMLPSLAAPLTARRLGSLYSDVGVPDGLCNVVLGDGRSIGDDLTTHPLVQMVGFTGSTTTGRRIATHCGRLGKQVTLEMGGKNPLLILPDADLSKAIPAAILGAFLYQGQICMSSSRILIHDSIYDDVIDRLVGAASGLPMGDLRDPTTVIGPIIHATQRERIQQQLDDAVELGAKLLCGGNWHGNRMEPTLLADTRGDMVIASEETFGPVATIGRFSQLDEAIDDANATPFGLSASIFTRDLDAAMQFARQSTAGMVHVNGGTLQEEAHVPFGGTGDSGFGREGALVGIEELTQWQWVTMAPSRRSTE